jgi:hypothetical protein
MTKYKQNKIADYLNNYEQRKKYMNQIKNWALVFFFITYAYLLLYTINFKYFTYKHVCTPCNTQFAIDSLKSHYQYKLDSLSKIKRKFR